MFPPSANDIRDERCRYERGGKNQFGKIEDVPRYIINGTVPAPPAQISGNGVIEKVIHAEGRRETEDVDRFYGKKDEKHHYQGTDNPDDHFCQGILRRPHTFKNYRSAGKDDQRGGRSGEEKEEIQRVAPVQRK